MSPSRGRVDHTESQASNYRSLGVRAALHVVPWVKGEGLFDLTETN